MKKHIFFTSLILTVLIFSTAVLVNYSLDFFRVASIVNVMNEHEISSEAYLTEESFMEAFGGDKCASLNRNIEHLKEEIKRVGTELSNYGKISFFREKEYDYLERKYFLLELKFLSLIDNLNSDCNARIIPILFFYETDNQKSERQGYILSEISDKYGQQVVVLSVKWDYEDEPLVGFFKSRYNVTKAPTLVVDNEMKYERLVYAKELESTIEKLIADSDFYGSGMDFGFVLDSAGFSREDFIKAMEDELALSRSDFAKGDIMLMLGRLSNNSTQICDSLMFYERISSENPEEMALLYETIASIGCKGNKRELLLNASRMWRQAGSDFRAEIDADLAVGFIPELKFETSLLNISRNRKTGFSHIVIGVSYANLTENDILVSQADRVTRDWLGRQIYSSPFSGELLTVFSERLFYSEEELLPEIGWHEGARIKEIKQSGLKHVVASGTIVARHDGKWYAPDEKGIFRFEVPIDKVLYPTTRFLRENIAVIIDTHGINMIVEQAIRNNATVAVGCCDHEGKIKAAKYLAEKGVNVLCFADKYLPLILDEGYTVFGSPPIKHTQNDVIIGNQPIMLSAESTIVAENVGDYSEVQSYYDTPARYFRELNKIAGINVVYVSLSRMNQTEKVIDAAESFGAEAIGVRIFNSDDYKKVKEWLEKNKNNKAVLFHSMPYPYGYRLIREFPAQTTFGDINPIFI